MSGERPAFHLAFVVDDLEAARGFYTGLLGCTEGRSSECWVDFDLHGHQIVAHLDDTRAHAERRNPVDGESIPVPHFGLVLDWDDWHALAERLRAASVDFVRAPGLRFVGEVGEQGTLFLRDPAGNALEFKTFREPDQLFAR